jgi:hypothetical protein
VKAVSDRETGKQTKQLKAKIMKSIKKLSRTLTIAALAVAVAALMVAPMAVLAQEKGAQKLMRLNTVKTVEDLQKVDAGDVIIMSCPKCKDTYATVVEKSFKNATADQLKTVAIHLCPTCETKMVSKGHGKAAKDTLVHTCKSCGSKDVSCCVMKKGTGTTGGMEEKK